MILLVVLVFTVSLGVSGQLIGFRVAANSGLFISELGSSDIPHPDALLQSPATSSDKFTPELSVGFEGEVLFQVTEKTYFGVELDYSHFKGYNDNPPVYNYFLTPYFQHYQDEFIISPVAYNTRLFNLAVNYKYFFIPEKQFTPFVKLTGVVAFVTTDLTYRELPDPELEWDILYSRGTKNSEQDSWPAFHIGGGIGFDYKINNRMTFQVDGTCTVLNSGIIDGVPNFTYSREEDIDLLKYNRRLSLTAQISAGLVYLIEFEDGRGKSGGGRTDPNLPFYRKKN